MSSVVAFLCLALHHHHHLLPLLPLLPLLLLLFLLLLISINCYQVVIGVTAVFFMGGGREGGTSSRESLWGRKKRRAFFFIISSFFWLVTVSKWLSWPPSNWNFFEKSVKNPGRIEAEFLFVFFFLFIFIWLIIIKKWLLWSLTYWKASLKNPSRILARNACRIVKEPLSLTLCCPWHCCVMTVVMTAVYFKYTLKDLLRIPERSLKHSWNIPEISLKYPWNIPDTSSKTSLKHP